MDEYRMARRVLMALGSKWRAGARETEVRLDGWCVGALGNTGMTVEDDRQCPKDRKQLRVLVHL